MCFMRINVCPSTGSVSAYLVRRYPYTDWSPPLLTRLAKSDNSLIVPELMNLEYGHRLRDLELPNLYCGSERRDMKNSHPIACMFAC